jgi:hypothetical protein
MSTQSFSDAMDRGLSTTNFDLSDNLADGDERVIETAQVEELMQRMGCRCVLQVSAKQRIARHDIAHYVHLVPSESPLLPRTHARSRALSIFLSLYLSFPDLMRQQIQHIQNT